jgi:hypothetical protein
MIALALAAAGGALLAALYLAVLWRSARAIGRRERPASAMLAGAAARIALVCAGLWLLGRGGGAHAAAAALAFLSVRALVLAVVRRRTGSTRPSAPALGGPT